MNKEIISSIAVFAGVFALGYGIHAAVRNAIAQEIAKKRGWTKDEAKRRMAEWNKNKTRENWDRLFPTIVQPEAV